MARFNNPWTQNIRGAPLTVKSPTPETLFRAIATQLVGLRQSAVGTSRQARQRLLSLLEKIPCLDNFDSGEAESECWWISFELNTSSPLAWRVVHKLGVLLNTRCSSKHLPVIFKPVPQESSENLRWEIASTAPGLDAGEIARWLRDNLPSHMDDETAWMGGDEE